MVYNAKMNETRGYVMKGENVRLFKPFDILLFLLIAAIAVVLPLIALPDANAEVFTVSSNGEEKDYSLQNDISFTVESEGHILTVVCKNRQVFVESSTCADQVCVRSGVISNSSEIIVCAPAKISIKINGEGEYDGTVK